MQECPRCKTELHRKRYNGVFVLECPHGHGMFFDRGELEEARNNADEDLRWLDFIPFRTSGLEKLHHEQVACPHCHATMEALRYSGSSVVINKCTKCEGVWLDNGEFEKIVAYLERLVASETSSELAEDVKKQLGEVFSPQKKEGEEIEDLMAVTRLLEKRLTAEHPVIEKILEVYYELTPFK